MYILPEETGVEFFEVTRQLSELEFQHIVKSAGLTAIQQVLDEAELNAQITYNLSDKEMEAFCPPVESPDFMAIVEQASQQPLINEVVSAKIEFAEKVTEKFGDIDGYEIIFIEPGSFSLQRWSRDKLFDHISISLELTNTGTIYVSKIHRGVDLDKDKIESTRQEMEITLTDREIIEKALRRLNEAQKSLASEN